MLRMAPDMAYDHRLMSFVDDWLVSHPHGSLSGLPGAESAPILTNAANELTDGVPTLGLLPANLPYNETEVDCDLGSLVRSLKPENGCMA